MWSHLLEMCMFLFIMQCSRGISPDGVVFLKLTMETQSGKRKAEIGLPTSSRQQKRARVHLFRDSYTAKWPYIVPSECDDYAFCKVCDDSFFVAHGGGNYEFM